MKSKMQVLVIEDNEIYSEIMFEVLAQLGHKSVLAKNGAESRLKFSNQSFDFVIMNMDLKGLNPLDFVNHIREAEIRKNLKERLPILVCGDSAEAFQRDFSQIDNLQFLPKPFSPLEFKQKVESFFKRSGLKQENMLKVGKGKYLITEGGSNYEMYWVLAGQFTISKLNERGESVAIGEVKRGELLGEMSFLDNLPRSASVRADEDSEVLVIPYKKFMDVLDDQPRWFRSLMTTLSHRLRDADDRLAKNSVKIDEK